MMADAGDVLTALKLPTASSACTGDLDFKAAKS
jgi:seryl-tRNA synthetase